MILIDTHTHLYVEEFDGDRDEAVARALDAGVRAMMCPAIDSSTLGRMMELCRRYPDSCFPMAGLHPTSINDNPHWRKELSEVEELLSRWPAGTFRAVGEVGLDFYWSQKWRGEQEKAFARHIELSLMYGLPLVIHTREAWPEMIAMLRRFRGGGSLRGVMHAFGGTEQEYLAVKECGNFLFGIGGPVTYKKSAVKDAAAFVPLADMVLETDSPYLTPAPMRGKRNESAYLKYICDEVARIKGLTPEEVASVTTANAAAMFGLSELTMKNRL